MHFCRWPYYYDIGKCNGTSWAWDPNALCKTAGLGAKQWEAQVLDSVIPEFQYQTSGSTSCFFWSLGLHTYKTRTISHSLSVMVKEDTKCLAECSALVSTPRTVASGGGRWLLSFSSPRRIQGESSDSLVMMSVSLSLKCKTSKKVLRWLVFLLFISLSMLLYSSLIVRKVMSAWGPALFS